MKNFLYYFTILLILSTGCTNTPVNPDEKTVSHYDINIEYNKAKQLYDSKSPSQTDQAIAILKENIKREPGHLDSLLLLGYIHLELEKYPEALEYADTAIKSKDGMFHPGAIYINTMSLIKLKRFEEASNMISLYGLAFELNKEYQPMIKELKRTLEDESKNTMEVYTNIRYGFSFKIPPTWKVHSRMDHDPESNSALIMFGLAPVYSELEKHDVENSMSVSAYRKENFRSLNSFVELSFRGLADFEELLEKEEIPVDEGRLFKYKSYREGYIYISQMLYLEKNDIYYCLMFTATPGTYEINIHQFDEFRKSVEFSPPESRVTLKELSTTEHVFQPVENFEPLQGDWEMIYFSHFLIHPRNFIDTDKHVLNEAPQYFLKILDEKMKIYEYDSYNKMYKQFSILNSYEVKDNFYYDGSILRFTEINKEYGITNFFEYYYRKSDKNPETVRDYILKEKYLTRESIPEKKYSWGYARDGLILGIKMPKKIRSKKDIIITYFIKNISSAPLYVKTSFDNIKYVDIHVVIKNTNNELLFITDSMGHTINLIALETQQANTGKIVLTNKSMEYFNEKYGPLGYIRGYENRSSVDISNLPKGKYEIYLFYSFPFPYPQYKKAWKGVIKSKPITFKITN